MSHLDPELLSLIALGEPCGAAETAHLTACAQCASEVDELRSVVALARVAGPGDRLESPPPGLWLSIAAEAGVRPDPGFRMAADPAAVAAAIASPDVVASPDTARRPERDRRSAAARRAGPGRGRGWQRRWRLAAATGLAGLVLGVGGTLAVHELTGPAHPAALVQVALRPLPQFPQWSGASGTATMTADAAGRHLSVTLKAPRKPGFYEVWLLARNGVSMISLGDLGPAHTGEFTIPPGVNLHNYSRIDISLQQFNGSPLHSRTSVVRGALLP
ncbi:MAG: anti-sigma factor [Actinomycetota bacterium]|nr:anti-sigma factor [Actinomycetota bacterium]